MKNPLLEALLNNVESLDSTQRTELAAILAPRRWFGLRRGAFEFTDGDLLPQIQAQLAEQPKRARALAKQLLTLPASTFYVGEEFSAERWNQYGKLFGNLFADTELQGFVGFKTGGTEGARYLQPVAVKPSVKLGQHVATVNTLMSLQSADLYSADSAIVHSKTLRETLSAQPEVAVKVLAHQPAADAALRVMTAASASDERAAKKETNKLAEVVRTETSLRQWFVGVMTQAVQQPEASSEAARTLVQARHPQRDTVLQRFVRKAVRGLGGLRQWWNGVRVAAETSKAVSPDLIRAAMSEIPAPAAATQAVRPSEERRQARRERVRADAREVFLSMSQSGHLDLTDDSGAPLMAASPATAARGLGVAGSFVGDGASVLTENSLQRSPGGREYVVSSGGASATASTVVGEGHDGSPQLVAHAPGVLSPPVSPSRFGGAEISAIPIVVGEEDGTLVGDPEATVDDALAQSAELLRAAIGALDNSMDGSPPESGDEADDLENSMDGSGGDLADDGDDLENSMDGLPASPSKGSATFANSMAVGLLSASSVSGHGRRGALSVLDENSMHQRSGDLSVADGPLPKPGRAALVGSSGGPLGEANTDGPEVRAGAESKLSAPPAVVRSSAVMSRGG